MATFVHIVKDKNGVHQFSSQAPSLREADDSFYDVMERHGIDIKSKSAYTTIEASDAAKTQKVLAKLRK